MRMTLSTLYLRATLDVMAGFGFARSEALDVLNMNEAELESRTGRIEVDRLLPLFDHAANITDDPNIGLRTGYRFRIAAFSRTGAVYGYCKNLRQVIDINAKYQRLAIDVADIGYQNRPDGSGHFMTFRSYYSDQEKYRQVTDLVMGAYGTAYRWLSWGSGQDLQSVELPYATPDCTDLHKRVFQCDAVFGRDRAALCFTDTAMQDQLTTHDPERRAKLQAELDALLGAREAVASLRMAVEAAIRGALDNGQMSADIVAERLERPWRELRKQLADKGLSFRDLVDGVRQDIFMELNEADESFSAIAQALGYNDQAAFNRAFKRWYGMTPTQWRKS